MLELHKKKTDVTVTGNIKKVQVPLNMVLLLKTPYLKFKKN